LRCFRFDRISSFIAFNSKVVPFGNAIVRRCLKLSRVVFEIPTIGVPDFQAVPWLPHAYNLFGFNVLPDVMRTLSPVINDHVLLDVFNIQLFSANKPTVVSLGVHEIEVEREDLFAE